MRVDHQRAQEILAGDALHALTDSERVEADRLLLDARSRLRAVPAGAGELRPGGRRPRARPPVDRPAPHPAGPPAALPQGPVGQPPPGPADGRGRGAGAGRRPGGVEHAPGRPGGARGARARAGGGGHRHRDPAAVPGGSADRLGDRPWPGRRSWPPAFRGRAASTSSARSPPAPSPRLPRLAPAGRDLLQRGHVPTRRRQRLRSRGGRPRPRWTPWWSPRSPPGPADRPLHRGRECSRATCEQWARRTCAPAKILSEKPELSTGVCRNR